MRCHDFHLTGYEVRQFGAEIVLHLLDEYPHRPAEQSHIRFCDVERVAGTFHYRPEAEHRIEKRPDGRDFESVIPGGYGHFGLYPAELTNVTSFRPLR